MNKQELAGHHAAVYELVGPLAMRANVRDRRYARDAPESDSRFRRAN